MTSRILQASEVGIPSFPLQKEQKTLFPEHTKDNSAITSDSRLLGLFDLTSHIRARKAIEFGLHMKDKGYNIFIIGDDRSGRMTASLEFLKQYTQSFPKPKDWLYLNNFKNPNKPIPFAFPSDKGFPFRNDMVQAIIKIKELLQKAFSTEGYLAKIQKNTDDLEEQIGKELEEIRKIAVTYGLDLQRGQDGNIVIILAETTPPSNPPKTLDKLTDQEREKIEEGTKIIRKKLGSLTFNTREKGLILNEEIQQLQSSMTSEIISPILDILEKKYEAIPKLKTWFKELRADIIKNIALFLEETNKEKESSSTFDINFLSAEERYGVNVIVDHADDETYPIVIEPNPTFENLFGSIKYRGGQGGYETNFNLLRAGSLHKANGGVLIIRADAIAQNLAAWEALKAALRDKEIRIEDTHKANGVPMLMAPEPKPIPLDIKIILVGATRLYNAFFYADADFETYFKIKADIDSDLEATEENLKIYRDLIQKSCQGIANKKCTEEAIEALLGFSARKAGKRTELTANYEFLEDVIAEASTFSSIENASYLTQQHIYQALHARHARNSRIEETFQEEIVEGCILIDTEGKAIGQINALTVVQIGDYSFGMPARITARTFVGSLGIINIERMVEMGGPIQQKGVMVLEGFLNGVFAQKFPLSFGCSITFEQNYGGVEGDSASMAELCAILSSLADAPIRQDIAITGSVNQLGISQAVGGINEKIEGFFRTCSRKGLTGMQGVIIPFSNERNLCLHPDVSKAIQEGKFHIWSVQNVWDAIELLTGIPAGSIENKSTKNSIFRRIYGKLKSYDAILSEKEIGPLREKGILKRLFS